MLDHLSSSGNRGFSKTVVDSLRAHGEILKVPKGSTIINQGDVGHTFYILLTGAVEIRITRNEERYLPITRLGKYGFFGEMSLLSGENASADVVTLNSVELLALSAVEFRTALSDNAAFRDEMMSRLAQRIQATSSEAWSLSQQAETLNQLYREDNLGGAYIAKSGKMKIVRERMETLSSSSDPLFISGALGTGKLYTAQTIHFGNPSAGPLIVVDAERLGSQEMIKLAFGTTQELSPNTFRSTYGAVHLAHKGTLVVKRADLLDQASLEALAAFIQLSTTERFYPQTRLIITYEVSPHRITEKNRAVELFPEISPENRIELPLLANRRNDIIPLAHYFLTQIPGPEHKYLSRDAEHWLLTKPTWSRNVAGLRDILELAVQISGDDYIRAEHFFSGPKGEDGPSDYQIMHWPVIKWLLNEQRMNSLRLATLAVFGIIILLCITAHNTVAGRFANTIIWGVWEPALIISFLLFGHLWCTICPLSTGGVLVQKIGCLNKPPPSWLIKYAVWLGLGGFFLIIWTERIFHMTNFPQASGILLSSLLAASILCCIIFRREVWCRYVCPLGLLASSFSKGSMLNLQATTSVCSTYCTTHECFRGTDTRSGCTVSHHPLYATEGFNCKLCFDCFQICPHDSIKLSLRPLLQAVWTQGRIGQILTSFFGFIFGLAPLLLASQKLSWLHQTGAFTVMALTAGILGVILERVLARILIQHEVRTEIGLGLSYSFFILSWGPLMSYQLGHIPLLPSLVIQARFDSVLARFGSISQLTLLTVCQILVMAGAVGMFGIILWKLNQKFETGIRQLPSHSMKLLLGIGLIYTLSMVHLILI